MKDLGTKGKEMYDAMPATENKAPKVIYPEIDFPLSLIEGLDIKVDDDVEIRIKGRVSGMQDTKWTKRVSFEAKQGEVSKSKKDKSLLDG